MADNDLAESAPGGDYPNLLAAFRTTMSGERSFVMTFRFPSMEAMHAADDEWHALRKAVERKA